MKTGLMKIFPILLTFYTKLVFREGIFGTAASLIAYFVIHELWSSSTLQTATVLTNFFFVERETWEKDVKKFFDKVSMFIIHESRER